MAAVAVLPALDFRTGLPNLGFISRAGNAAQSFLDYRARRCVVDKSLTRSSSSQSHVVRKPIEDDFAVDYKNILGTGHSGSVVVATERSTGQEFALKSYDKKAMTRTQIEMLKSEIEISFGLKHPNVVRLASVYEDKLSVNLVIELCRGRDLFDRLQMKGVFSEESARSGAKQMLQALLHLHAQGIAHRDVKLENWLYDSPSDSAVLKLADFGFSRRWDESTQLHGSYGSTQYMAPEVRSGCYTDKCDMWSFGVVVYTLLTGKFPFHASSKEETIGRIMTCDLRIPDSLSSQAQDFLTKLIVPNPAKRMTASQCLEHLWICDPATQQGWSGEAIEDLPVLSSSTVRTRSAMQDVDLLLLSCL